jgi:hypothetical protein
MPQHATIRKELLGPKFPDSGWMTGKQILMLVMSRAIGTRYKKDEASANIRSNLFDILLIQSGKRGISIDRQKARELVDLVFIEEQNFLLVTPDGWDKKIDCLLGNQYCNRCGILIEIEHDLIECNARILKEVMES